MYWWRSQLIPCFSDRKIEIYPFLSVQRGVSGWVLLVGELRGSGGGWKTCGKLLSLPVSGSRVWRYGQGLYHKSLRGYTMNKSEAIAKSWKNPKTREKRSNRYPVRVNGKEYKSVPAAFEALGLPKSKRIRFRGELVAASGFANPQESRPHI